MTQTVIQRITHAQLGHHPPAKIFDLFFDRSGPNRHNHDVSTLIDLPVLSTLDRSQVRPHRRSKPSTRRDPMLTPSERLELNRLASPENLDETLRLRAHIVLSWAAGATGEESARLLETSRRTVSKWRTRFRKGGVDALVDRPRPGAPRSVDEHKISLLLRLQNSPPPSGKSRWTTRLLAQHTGLSQSTVVRISRDYGRDATR
jgi:transposase